MSEATFSIEVSDEHRLRSDSTVYHREHGPMVVESVRVGPYHKEALLQSGRGPEALTLSDDDLREAWGETIHIDPMEVQQATVEFPCLRIDGLDIEVELSVSGDADFESVERIATHGRDQIVRAMQAELRESRPEYCEGTGVAVDWDAVLESTEDGDTR